MKHPAATTTTVVKAAMALSLLVLYRSVDGFAPTLVSKAMTVMSAGRFSRGDLVPSDLVRRHILCHWMTPLRTTNDKRQLQPVFSNPCGMLDRCAHSHDLTDTCTFILTLPHQSINQSIDRCSPTTVPIGKAIPHKTILL